MKPGIPVTINDFNNLNLDKEKIISSLGLLDILGAVTYTGGYYTRN
jgi:hypothetical protein